MYVCFCHDLFCRGVRQACSERDSHLDVLKSERWPQITSSLFKHSSLTNASLSRTAFRTLAKIIVSWDTSWGQSIPPCLGWWEKYPKLLPLLGTWVPASCAVTKSSLMVFAAVLFKFLCTKIWQPFAYCALKFCLSIHFRYFYFPK